MEVAARRFDTSYDADAEFDGTRLQDTLNRTTTGLQGKVRYKLTPLSTLAVRFEDLGDRFEFFPTRDSDSYRIMPGVEFKPRALVNGSAYIGYRQFTPRHPEALPEFSGLVANLGLSYTWLGSTTLGVTYRRDLTYSYEETQPFFVDNSVGGSVRRALGHKFDVLLSIDRHTYDYKDMLDGSVKPPLDQRTDVTWNYAGTVGYRIGHDVRFGFGAGYWKRQSTTVQFRDYDNWRIGTTATYGF
jgi:hypothetical protein